MIIGIVNSVIINIINFVYSWMADFFVKWENHKYNDSYEKSYVLKMFIFKFINTNLSIIYTAFVIGDFKQLYDLILGMVVTKVVTILLLKNGMKIVKNWLMKKMYFRKVKAAALERKIKY